MLKRYLRFVVFYRYCCCYCVGQRLITASTHLIQQRKMLSTSGSGSSDSDDVQLTIVVPHSSNASQTKTKVTTTATAIDHIDIELTYQLTCQSTTFTITGRHLMKLLRLYRLHTNALATCATALFVRNNPLLC